MKKLLLFLSILTLFISCNTIYAEEACNSYYKVNINIEGNGVIKDKLSDKSYTKDAVVNIKCSDSFIFKAEADDTYNVQGVYIDGSHLTSDNNVYSINDITSNVNLKIVFKEDEKDAENEEVFSSYENSISLFIADLKENLDSKTVIKLFLKEVTVVLDNDFIKNSSDNITVTANEIYKKDLNNKEQRAVKQSMIYDINVYSSGSLVDDLKGKAIVTIPYSKGKDVYVYRVSNVGKITLVDSKYKDGKVTFKVDKLGTFALSKEKLDELGYVRSIINLNNKQKIAIISVGFALALLIVFIKIKRRK